MSMTPTPPKSRSGSLWVILLLLAAGIGLAAYLIYAKLGVQYLPDFDSGCNFGGKMNCDAVQTHPSSTMFGLPVGLFAIPAYLVMAFLAWRALKGPDDEAKTSAAYLAGIALLSVLFSLYLLAMMLFEIDALCPFCLAMDAINVAILALAIRAHGGGLVAPFKAALAALGKARRPMAGAAVTLLVAGAGALFAYNSAQGAMVDAQKTRLAAAFEGQAPLSDATPAPAPNTPTSDHATPAATAPPTPVAKPKATLTDLGYDYYEIPVGPDDYVWGNPDAAVTMVTLKDFECGFCRFLSTQAKSIKEKYKDKVRFVFKHYPMNADCNYRMGSSRMHDGACRAAFASHCAHEQGKFWEMHDLLYANQKKFSDEQLTGYATDLGLDMGKYAECYASDRPMQRITEDVKLSARMRVNGTPRVYINNRMVSARTKDLLDYYLQLALEHPVAPANVSAVAPTQDTPTMVEMKKAAGTFFIDTFEASIDHDGRALSVPGVKPALASWFEAKAACEKAGKRMCSEEEWVSACIGEPAADPDSNGIFTDGAVSGRLYPYGAFYDKGACRDSEDKYAGHAGDTGSNPRCRTPEGVYDLSGNLYEWVGADVDKSAQIGGDWRSQTAGTCRRRSTTYGAGIKNNTTGFRCCADSFVAPVAKAADVEDTTIADIVGKSVPADLVLDTLDGGKLSPASFKGKVSYLTFFASWCGNCRKQMPAIKAWQEKWQAKGFQVVAINVDRVQSRGESYIKQLEPNFTVALDPAARTMSDFDINAMPTSFIIGRDGQIVRRVLGYKEAEIPATMRAIEALLGG